MARSYLSAFATCGAKHRSAMDTCKEGQGGFHQGVHLRLTLVPVPGCWPLTLPSVSGPSTHPNIWLFIPIVLKQMLLSFKIDSEFITVG